MHPYLAHSLTSRPPHGSDATNDGGRIRRHVFTSASSAAELILDPKANVQVYNFRASQDCYARWGLVGVTAALTSDFMLRQWEIYPFLITPYDHYLRALRVATDGYIEFWNTSTQGP